MLSSPELIFRLWHYFGAWLERIPGKFIQVTYLMNEFSRNWSDPENWSGVWEISIKIVFLFEISIINFGSIRSLCTVCFHFRLKFRVEFFCRIKFLICWRPTARRCTDKPFDSRRASICNWLRRVFKYVLQCEPQEIEPQMNLPRMGLCSWRNLRYKALILVLTMPQHFLSLLISIFFSLKKCAYIQYENLNAKSLWRTFHKACLKTSTISASACGLQKSNWASVGAETAAFIASMTIAGNCNLLSTICAPYIIISIWRNHWYLIWKHTLETISIRNIQICWPYAS